MIHNLIFLDFQKLVSDIGLTQLDLHALITTKHFCAPNKYKISAIKNHYEDKSIIELFR